MRFGNSVSPLLSSIYIRYKLEIAGPLPHLIDATKEEGITKNLTITVVAFRVTCAFRVTDVDG